VDAVSATQLVLDEVRWERQRQDVLWGEQNHPDRLGHMSSHAARAEVLKQVNARRVRSGTLCWDGILLEEVYEALAETDPGLLRAELIQVAAVAAGWVEAIDRRAAVEVA
jgi:hypothetical protein